VDRIGLSLVITVVAVLSAVAFEIVAAGVARPALAADPSNGMRVAQLWCATCHVVTVNQRQANADARPSRRSRSGQISASRAS
jgi:mono/diheme cytochrome c family protein